VWPRVASGLAREGARRVGAVDGGAKVAPRRMPHRGEAPREPGVLERLVERAPVRQLALLRRGHLCCTMATSETSRARATACAEISISCTVTIAKYFQTFLAL